MPALEQREFDRWREADEQFKEEMRTHATEQRAFNLDIAQRVKGVEIFQNQHDGYLSRKATWLSAVIAAIVGGVVTLFGSWSWPHN